MPPFRELSESAIDSGDSPIYYFVKLSSIYRTSACDCNLGLNGGFIYLLIIMSQLTPANHGCLMSSSPSSGPPPNLYVGSATKILASKSLHSFVMFSGIFILQAFIFSNSSSLFVPLRMNGG